MANIAGAAGLSFLQSSSKSQAIAAALGATGGSWLLLGLDGEGLGTRNHMTIENGSGKTMRLHQYYLHWGKVKEPPVPTLAHLHQDEALFHAAGGWAMSGSGGIVTYEIDRNTFLHIMWDCPISFTFSDNFVGLYICDGSNKTPNGALYKAMYQDRENPKMTPKRLSFYDLVCCGPGDGTFIDSAGATGKTSWGVRRPCEVIKNDYYASMVMGDRHPTSSKITILEKTFWPEGIC